MVSKTKSCLSFPSDLAMLGREGFPKWSILAVETDLNLADQAKHTYPRYLEN